MSISLRANPNFITFKIIRNLEFKRTLLVNDNLSNPVDLSTLVAATLKVRPELSSTTVYTSLSLGDGIELGTKTGYLDITFSEAKTVLILGEKAAFDILLEFPNSEKYLIAENGTIEITDFVSRN